MSPLAKSVGMNPKASFLAFCKTVYAEEFVSFVVEDAEDKEESSTKVEFSIILRPGRLQLWITILLIASGSFITGLPNTNVFIVILKIIGSALIGLGTYLGFKKTPV